MLKVFARAALFQNMPANFGLWLDTSIGHLFCVFQQLFWSFGLH